jgi:hypothetical protein
MMGFTFHMSEHIKFNLAFLSYISGKMFMYATIATISTVEYIR